MRNVSLFICILFLMSAQAQEKRSINTLPIESEIIVDGKFSEPDWQNAEVGSEFIQSRPEPMAPATYDTEVRVLYSSNALYVAMEMFDPNPDSILHQLTERDKFGNTSWAGVVINGFQDGINAFEFFVTVEGVQFDASVTTYGEDFAWNAVWTSATQITDRGWNLEMKIPYSAFRFPENEVQEWDINFIRVVRRIREQTFWNPIDPDISGFVNQMGVVKGIKNIEPATRLFFYPYMGLQYDTFSDDTGTSTDLNFSAGMDLKYGLNNSYTLDMTLIPDFGQVASDDQVLNLSPFEVRFDENRQFFTEGTELFNKGDLFYSRRIGARPVNIGLVYDKEDEGYEVVSNPSQVSLLNAMKVSGRNSKGLGMGFFNAVTNRSVAVVKDSLGSEEEIETAPFTNYNIMVLDQNLKNNSYISLINTNVLRDGAVYDANVTAVELDIRDKNQRFKVEGGGAYNIKTGLAEEENNDGYAYYLELSNIKGKLNYGLEYEDISDSYDPNDLGFLNNNNERSTELWVNFNQYEPGKRYNNYWFFANAELSTLSSNNAYTVLDFYSEIGRNDKNFNAMGFETYFAPMERHDYFETRDFSRYLKRPATYNFGGWISSDYRKRFALDTYSRVEFLDSPDWFNWRIRFQPRFRVNDQLSITYEIQNQYRTNDEGYVTTEDDEIIIGRRDVDIRSNVLSGQYVFNNKMGLTFRLRHYWSKLRLKEFYGLIEDGELGSTTYNSFDENKNTSDNRNFNTVNSDIVFRWVFSPGSEMSLVWKTNILNSDDIVTAGFAENLEDTFDLPTANSFSIRVLYFIDYLSLKRKA